MGNKLIELEVCSNMEWLRNNCLGVIDSEANDAAATLSNRVYAGLLNAGYDVWNPRGQRILFHGWNGARWRWHYGPVGTFCELTKAQRTEIQAIVDKAEASVRTEWKWLEELS